MPPASDEGPKHRVRSWPFAIVAVLAVLAVGALASCGDDGDGGSGSSTQAGTTEADATEPSATEPGATEPGATEPGATEPGTTDPPERPPPGVACTLIACSSGVTVELRRVPAAAHDARLCVEGTCRTTDLSRPALAARAPLPRSARHDGARVLVTLLLRNSQGAPIQRYRKRATVQRTRPNGPKCPPVCFQAALRLAGGQLVQRPPVP